MSRLCVPVVIVFAIIPNILRAGEAAAAEEGEGGHRRVVVRLASVPATKAADALKQLFEAEGQAASSSARSVVILPEVHSNSLLLAGSPRAVEEVRQLVMQMDHAAFIVHMEVVIAEAPVAEVRPSESAEKPEGDSDAGQARLLERPEEMVIIGRAEFTTLSDQPAHVQISYGPPKIREIVADRGPRSRSGGFPDEGVAIKMRSRVGPDQKITISIDVRDSWLGPAEKDTTHATPKEGESPQTRKAKQFQVATTVITEDGQTVVLGGAARQPNASTERLVLVTPRIQLVNSRAVPRR